MTLDMNEAMTETKYFVALESGENYEELTESEIRQRLQLGTLKQSQLIWDATEQVWKEAQQFAVFQTSPLPDVRGVLRPTQVKPATEANILEELKKKTAELKKVTTYFVATPEEDKDYTELPRTEIERRIKEGKLKKSQLIWHPTDQAWKKAKQIPQLNVPQELNPPINDLDSTTSKTKEEVKKPTAVKVPSTITPVVNVVTESTTKKTSRPIKANELLQEEERKEQSWFKYYSMASLGILLAIVLLNWAKVEQPLQTVTEHPDFKGKVTLHGHYSGL